MADHPPDGNTYPLWTRRRLVEGSAHLEGTTRSVQRYKRKLRDGESLAPKKRRGGTGCHLSQEAAFVIWWFCTVLVAASHDDLAGAVLAMTRETASQSQITRELARLGLTRKVLNKRSAAQNEDSRINFWRRGPLFGWEVWGVPQTRGRRNFAGIYGIPTSRIIDIDEMGCYGIDEFQPTHGYAEKGERAYMRLPFGGVRLPAVCQTVNLFFLFARSSVSEFFLVRFGPQDKKSGGVKTSLLVACDINVGVVAYWAAPMVAIDADAFYLWCTLCLLPKIRGQNRVIMMDNLRAHSNSDIDELFRAEGHVLLYRPVHSPEFGPIEYCFSWLRTTMKVLPAAPTPTLPHPSVPRHILQITRTR